MAIGSFKFADKGPKWDNLVQPFILGFMLCCSVLTLFIFLTNNKSLLLWQHYKERYQELHSCFGNIMGICLEWERTQEQGKPLGTKHITTHSQQKLIALFLQHSKPRWKWNEQSLVSQTLCVEKWHAVWRGASGESRSPRLQLCATTLTSEIQLLARGK